MSQQPRPRYRSEPGEEIQEVVGTVMLPDGSIQISCYVIVGVMLMRGLIEIDSNRRGRIPF